jgi:hypothetical protein
MLFTFFLYSFALVGFWAIGWTVWVLLRAYFVGKGDFPDIIFSSPAFLLMALWVWATKDRTKPKQKNWEKFVNSPFED